MTVKADKLTEGHKYLFNVVAENCIGVSEPCETDSPTEAKLPFGKKKSQECIIKFPTAVTTLKHNKSP